MNAGRLLYWLVVVLAVVYGGIRQLFGPYRALPDIGEDLWFGAESARSEIRGELVHPFQVEVDEAGIVDLKQRLENARFSSNDLEDVRDGSYGTDSAFLREIRDYWLNKFDWNQQVETVINKFPQFTTHIAGLRIHFIHARATIRPGVKVVPLLIIHGWPGSIFEFHKLLPLLTEGNGTLAFDVIAPSIPGYGWSEAPKRAGFNALRAAQVFSRLMQRLGYSKFIVQGGDWGSITATALAQLYPTTLLGLHINFPVAAPPFGPFSYAAAALFPKATDGQKILPLSSHLADILLETGYMHEQATRPHTLGSALADTPIGLAGWIIEKFWAWSDCHGDVLSRFSFDELLTNVMIYWTTNTATSSVRFYREFFTSASAMQSLHTIVNVPTGILDFPKEIVRTPFPWLQRKYRKIVLYVEPQQGGHFAALEEPTNVASNLFEFAALLLANSTK